MKVEEAVFQFVEMIDNTRRFRTLLRGLMKDMEEKPHRIGMLGDLKETGKARLKDIAAKTGNSTQNLCMLYSGMEKEGLIARETDTFDRRNTYYCITKKGEKVLNDSKSKARGVIKDVFSGLSDKEVRELKDNLEKVNNILEKVL
jgi:DNA-binding MarR family transcriptional regulator